MLLEKGKPSTRFKQTAMRIAGGQPLMNGKRMISRLMLILMCSPMAYAASAPGEIHGVVRDSTGLPLPEVVVRLNNQRANSNRIVRTNEGGNFLAKDLSAGLYRVTATKEGYRSSEDNAVELADLQTLTVNITLEPKSQRAAESSTAPADLAPAITERERTLLERIDRLEQRLALLEARETKAADGDAKAPSPLVASLDPAMALAPLRALPLTTGQFPSGQALLPAQQPAPGAKASPTEPAGSAAPTQHLIPEAMQAPETPSGVDSFTPFAYGDFTWLNGYPRNKDTVLDTKFFTPEVRFDTHFMEDFNQPKDHSMGGTTESFRSGEFQVEQASVGGDFHWQNVRGRILTMFGLFGATTPRNDASSGVGQWDVRTSYRYISEAYGGYHFNVNHGLNVDAGIFVSYIGLFSYYNFDNWIYQPSYVSSNTPWFFNGLRIQWFPTNKLKIEPWIINGWQSYNEMNRHHGFGGQILYRPKEWLSLVLNNYGNGTDALGVPGRQRIHTDDSIEVRYFNRPESTGISKMAFSLTADAGCEQGGGVTCYGGKEGPKQAFLGWMGYNRIWFKKDQYALTFGGGKMNNPGRYLTLLPPINGADAISGSPYFTENPGDKAHMWDYSVGLQWMPKQYITWWLETGYHHSDVPYWTGRGGITPPGGNNGSPQYYVCGSGATAGTNNLAAATASCGGAGNVWFPDLRKTQTLFSAGVMVKF